jgi:hypothetical protein
MLFRINTTSAGRRTPCFLARVLAASLGRGEGFFGRLFNSQPKLSKGFRMTKSWNYSRWSSNEFA